MVKNSRLIIYCIFFFLFFISNSGVHASQGKCYVVVESTGSYDNLTITSIATSLLKKYVDPNTMPAPLAGFSEKECHYRINISEKKGSIKAFLFGNSISDYGTSELRAEKGLEQSILKAVFKGIADRSKRQNICRDHQEMLFIECHGLSTTQDRSSSINRAEIPNEKKRLNYNIGFTSCFMISWHRNISKYNHRAGLVAKDLEKVRSQINQKNDKLTAKLISSDLGVDVSRDKMMIDGREFDESDMFDDDYLKINAIRRHAKNLELQAVILYRLYRHEHQKTMKTLTTLLIDTKTGKVFRSENTTDLSKYLSKHFYEISKAQTQKVLDQFLAVQ